MAFTPFETSTTNISTLSDRPNQNDGLSSAQLKGRFDKAGNDIKTYINDVLLEELESVTDGDSGADNIGATAVGDRTATTVQGILEELDADITALDSASVHLTGNETIDGAKSFIKTTDFQNGITFGDPTDEIKVADNSSIGARGIQIGTENGNREGGLFIGSGGNDNGGTESKKLLRIWDGESWKQVWHEDNDGTGSGLDADTLDGAHSGAFVKKAGDETITGTKTFSVSPIVPAPTTDTQASTKKYVDDADVLKVNITDIVNDLTTGGTAVPLSAEQGKTLQGEVGALTSLSTTEKGSLVGAINEVDADVGTNATAIGTLASLTTTEKTNLVGAINELDTDKVETSAITNTLTETGTGKVLDARQGKTLSDKIGNQSYTEKNYIADGESATSSINKLDMQLKDTADLVSTKESITNVAAYLKNISPVYGILWDKGETPTLTRTDASVNMVANIGIDAQVVRNDFDSAPIYRDMVEVEDTLGNKFIRIPKFYIKKTDSTNYKQWQVSPYKHDGFYLPWCFWDFTNSKELPYIDVGKYNASLNGTKLASVASTYPLIYKNIVESRGYAQVNNAGGLLGYQQLDIHVIDILRTLFFIEFGTLNSQAIMQGFTSGQYATTHLAIVTETATNRIVVANAVADLYRVGQAISVGTSQGGNQKFYGRTITAIDDYDVDNKAISFDGDPVDIATGNLLYNTGWKSGFSSNIVASSGCIVANDGKYPCSYRGIENPFGSVWQLVDGVNITDNQAWVCKDAGQYASNVFASPYEKLSYVNINATGYGPVEMGYDTDLPFAEFATSVTGGSTSKHYCDYYYQASGNRIARFGGSWGSGLGAGLSAWDLRYDSSSAHVVVGGRLCKKAL